ncbi:YncE family protein [Nocardia sp. alder85J]|uniref:YncE family protein n=1 Tax=Nocardia sp. alder85J TaxID=2862949 RepID=UPI001CD3313E|nr:hypothetical protein [Nocardia sp. alder85J]MCX4092888.1 hypothetical protein [Nocardia sp. alder85J]
MRGVNGLAPLGAADRPTPARPGPGSATPADRPGAALGPRHSAAATSPRPRSGGTATRSRWTGGVLAAVAAVGVLTGCSSQQSGGKTPAAAPASAAVSPPVTTAPAGSVTTAPAIAALVAAPGGGRLAELAADGVTVTLTDLTGPGTAGNPAPAAPSASPAANGPAAGSGPSPRAVTLPARAATLAPGGPGEVLAAAGAQIVHIDTATGATRTTPVGADTRAVARRDDGTLAVALADHRVLIVGDDGHVVHTVTGLTGADTVAAAGDTVAVLDLAQTSLTELDLAHGKPALALRAGTGATGLIADHYQRLLVTDTAGGTLLVYTADPLVLRQRFPVGSSPYALAYDQRSETVWVTMTGSNEVVGFDLSTGIPEEVGRFATVRQPDSVTIDDRTGDMFVGSATGDGLQRIGADERKRGQ